MIRALAHIIAQACLPVSDEYVEKVEEIQVKAHVRKKAVNPKREAVHAELRDWVHARQEAVIPTEGQSSRGCSGVGS